MIEVKGRIKDVSRGMDGKHRLTLELDEFHPEWSLDGDLRVSLKKWRETRSGNANRLFWDCVGKIATAARTDSWSVYLEMLKRYGQFEVVAIPPDSLEAFKKVWREVEDLGVITIKGQQVRRVRCFYGSHTYDTEEFAALLDGTISEMKQMGLPTPAEEEVQRKLNAWQKSSGAH